MIIDHDESKKTGVMSLMARGSELVEQTRQTRQTEEAPAEKTLALPTVKLSELKEKGEIHPDSTVTGRLPRRKFVLAKSVGVVQVETEPMSKASADTGTHALPAVEKMTGKPSGAVDLHRSAKKVQDAMYFLGVAVWYGEYTKEFWVMDARGLHPFESVTAMYEGMGWQRY